MIYSPLTVCRYGYWLQRETFAFSCTPQKLSSFECRMKEFCVCLILFHHKQSKEMCVYLETFQRFLEHPLPHKQVSQFTYHIIRFHLCNVWYGMLCYGDLYLSLNIYERRQLKVVRYNFNFSTQMFVQH